MRRVSIRKLIQDESGAFVGMGQSYEGLELVRPMVGKEYVIFNDAGRVVKTSDVLSVKDGFFETRNSYYKLTIIEEEPFDLTGESSAQKTREIQLSRAFTIKG
jgi:hypothetical protein